VGWDLDVAAFWGVVDVLEGPDFRFDLLGVGGGRVRDVGEPHAGPRGLLHGLRHFAVLLAHGSVTISLFHCNRLALCIIFLLLAS